MREIVSLNVGQAGIQIGHALWSQMISEEEIAKNGVPEKNTSMYDHTAFFSESSSGRFSPRAVFVDGEAQAINQSITGGDLKNLFQPEFAISSYGDASNCFARGKFNVSKRVTGDTILALRRMIEQCESVNQMIVTHGIAGGTGSGLTSTIMFALTDMYAHLDSHSHCVFPSTAGGTTIVAPYNAILSLSDSQYYSLRYVYQNENILENINPVLQAQGISGTFAHINHAISVVNSTISSPRRFASSSSSLDCLETVLVPFPDVNFVMCSFVPFVHSTFKSVESEKALVALAFREVTEMCAFNPTEGKYLSAFLIFRGFCKYHDQHFYGEYAEEFASWNPKGFNFAISNNSLEHRREYNYFKNPNKGLLKISNHSHVIENTCAVLLEKYNRLYDRRAYVSWFITEGMEEGEFSEARETMENLLGFIKEKSAGIPRGE